ncbi:hypothetical protein [Legionella rubrilucens]|nr:hypothetical protein [Legionella rubrilucens]
MNIARSLSGFGGTTGDHGMDDVDVLTNIDNLIGFYLSLAVIDFTT